MNRDPPTYDPALIARLRCERAEAALDAARREPDAQRRLMLRSYGTGILYLHGRDPLGEEIARLDRVIGMLFQLNARLAALEVRAGVGAPSRHAG